MDLCVKKVGNGEDAPGPILELLSSFRILHDGFIADMIKKIPDFQQQEFKRSVSSNLCFYCDEYMEAINRVCYDTRTLCQIQLFLDHKIFLYFSTFDNLLQANKKDLMNRLKIFFAFFATK